MTGKSRGPYARTAQRREEIARAVFEIVLEKGHAAVTTAEVAERSDTREATVLYHFPTKDHLLVAALQFAEDEDTDATTAFSPDALKVLNLEGLRDFAKAVPRREAIMRLYTSLAGSATIPDHPAQEYFANHYGRAVEEYAVLVRQRQDVGLAHPGLDPVEVARQFLAVWDGLQAQWLVDQSFDLPEALVSAFRRLSGQNWMEARQALLAPDAGI
jgi:AcrR family transcriptional regulator